jgi:putative effector of murein hydrolase LrgA (UPF0299 family)
MNLIERAKNIIVTPKTEWQVIAAEEPNAMAILTGYVIPLALIPAVASVIGYGLVGQGFALIYMGNCVRVISFVSTVVGVYVTAFVVDLLARTSGHRRTSAGRCNWWHIPIPLPGWLVF